MCRQWRHTCGPQRHATDHSYMHYGREKEKVFVCFLYWEVNLRVLKIFLSSSKSLNRLQDIITEISEKEKNFKILVYANGFKKIRITEKIIKELGIDTFAYERTNVGRRRRAMKEKVYYSKTAVKFS